METFSALLALCAGNSPVTGEFPSQRLVMRNFDIFFDLRLNKRLSKQSWSWWFETPSCPLRRHCNGTLLRRPSCAVPYVHKNMIKTAMVRWHTTTPFADDTWVQVLSCVFLVATIYTMDKSIYAAFRWRCIDTHVINYISQWIELQCNHPSI